MLRAAQVLGLDPADYETCTKSQIKAAWFKLKTTVRGREGACGYMSCGEKP